MKTASLFVLSAILLQAQTTIPQPFNGIQGGPYEVQVSALGLVALLPLTLPTGCTAGGPPWSITCPPPPATINYTKNGTVSLTLAKVQMSLGTWKPSTACFAGDLLTDSAGNLEQSFTTATQNAAALGTSGATVPAWTAALWGFTTDGTCTRQNIGPSSQLWCMAGGLVGPSAIAASAFVPFWVQESYQVTVFQTVGGVTSPQGNYGPYPRGGFIEPTPSAGDPYAWAKADLACGGAPSLTFNSMPSWGEQRLGVAVTGHW